MKRPDFQDEPPHCNELTSYDREHSGIYLRLLDAEADGAPWEDIVEIVFGLEPEKEPARAARVYESHIARAKWMTEHGYRNLIRPSYS